MFTPLLCLLALHAPPLTLRGDLDGDGWADTVTWRHHWLSPARGDERGLIHAQLHGARGEHSQVYRAFKARLADLDGDGRDEILIGVWLSAPRHDEPQPHRAIWVLSWRGGGLTARWRGSGLARPLLDFEISPQGQLIALEAGGGWRLTTYAWTGFGFIGRGRARRCPPPLVGLLNDLLNME
ncbi:VCBS repeat-containing protein [Myxococcota bacterium]|nr:VCBS repeat-containing protein [Myxococcota bacterium]MBU1898132.1 VCBS repeat-containing protein [Myxococcota bacterium]